MKRLVFLLVAFTCTMFTSIASADVGFDKGKPLQTYTGSSQQTFISSDIVFTVDRQTPVVCVAQDKQYPEIRFLAKAANVDPFTFIDPGICLQVYKNYNVQRVCVQNCLSTARHVQLNFVIFS